MTSPSPDPTGAYIDTGVIGFVFGEMWRRGVLTGRGRGGAASPAARGVPGPPAATAFRGRAYLDFLYGEIWTRQKHLTRRDRRIVSICCAAAAGVDEEVAEHLRAALAMQELTFE